MNRAAAPIIAALSVEGNRHELQLQAQLIAKRLGPLPQPGCDAAAQGDGRPLPGTGRPFELRRELMDDRPLVGGGEVGPAASVSSGPRSRTR